MAKKAPEIVTLDDINDRLDRAQAMAHVLADAAEDELDLAYVLKAAGDRAADAAFNAFETLSSYGLDYYAKEGENEPFQNAFDLLARGQLEPKQKAA